MFCERRYGLIPRTNRGIFCINELPDLTEKLQVGLFNLMEESDVQIRGYRIRLPLDVFLVRKLGTPGNEELAMGAIASGGIRVMNEDVVRELRISNAAIEAVAMKEGVELRRREEAYREKRPPLDVEGRTVIVVDDGLATGATMRAAVLALKKLAPRRLVVAVPTAAPDTCDAFREEVDEIICGMTPEPFYGVGAWYEQFPQNTDDEVRERLVDSDRGAGKK